MKIIYLAICVVFLMAFTPSSNSIEPITTSEIVEITVSSFSLTNDTKEKIQIHTGSGFVTLNKGSKTSITCKVGKEVRWAESGKKKAVIFEITSDMCGKSLKISKLM